MFAWISTLPLTHCITATAILLAMPANAQGDAFIRDAISDSGIEPYIGSDPVYLSPDIWIRQNPDPSHTPTPFNTASPSWTPLPHQNPEYRDPKGGQPNYIYVRIHNRGTQPTTGTERLRLYQAKASTGLSWPASWVDNMATACGASLLHGIEITKPRRNASQLSVTEQQTYRDAVIALQTNPQYQYLADGVQYWRKQNAIHATAGNPEHGTAAFLPWHREMMNQFETLLREHDPLLTLPYWDWTENPAPLFTNNFMGNGNGTVSGPLAALQPPVLSRDVGSSPCQFLDDPSMLSFVAYPLFADALESGVWPQDSHNCAHGFIGGGGQMSSQGTAAQDPFFFLLHANVDRIWATWQRAGAIPARINRTATYGNSASDASITDTMSPWDGATNMTPWTGTGAFFKTSTNSSVVYPPIYDTAPLNIPVLQPNQSVILEIPWFPPDVNNFNCAGESGHFCLLARIETEVAAPFGMSVAEGMNVATNTANNNNIAWRNVEIVDNVSDPSFSLLAGTTIQNIFDRDAIFLVRLKDRTEKRRAILQEFADIALKLPDDILKRLEERKGGARDLELTELKGVEGPVLRVIGKEPAFKILMAPGERFTLQFLVQLRNEKPDEALLAEPFYFDIEQELDLPREFFADKGGQGIGGVRFAVDFAQIVRDRELAERGIQLVDLQLDLKTEALSNMRSLAERPHPHHLSPGEPLAITVVPEGEERSMRRLSLEVDGSERSSVEGRSQLSETVTFETPGLHTIVTRGLGDDGEVMVSSTEVLVSENIPPVVAILSPTQHAQFKVGDSIEVVVETAPAFKQELKEVTLHVKDDDAFATGMNLVRSENYPAVDRAGGPSPHTLRFIPDKPGMYMLQVGAFDTAGNVGVSSHVMVMVE